MLQNDAISIQGLRRTRKATGACFRSVFSLVALGLAISLLTSVTRADDHSSRISNDSHFRSRDKERRSSLGNRSGEHDAPEGQQAILQAIAAGRGLDFVEIKDAKVARLLPDDDKGRRHQKWTVELTNGSEIAAVYNVDLSEPIELKVGDVMHLGGQYIYDRSGGLIHWLHEDPRGRRPDGYVEVNGKRYGEVENENANRRGRHR